MKTRRMGWKRKGFILAFLAPTVIAFVLFYLYPIVTSSLSLHSVNGITQILQARNFSGLQICGNNYKYIFEPYVISGRL